MADRIRTEVVRRKPIPFDEAFRMMAPEWMPMDEGFVSSLLRGEGGRVNAELVKETIRERVEEPTDADFAQYSPLFVLAHNSTLGALTMLPHVEEIVHVPSVTAMLDDMELDIHRFSSVLKRNRASPPWIGRPRLGGPAPTYLAAEDYISPTRESLQNPPPFGRVRNLHDAIELARSGWPEGVQRVADLTMEFENQWRHEVARPIWNQNVVGEQVDVPAYLRGEPEHMVEYSSGQTQSKVVNILVDGTVRCEACGGRRHDVAPTPPEWVLRRGVAIAALIKQLTLAQYKVSLKVITPVVYAHPDPPNDAKEITRMGDVSVMGAGTYYSPDGPKRFGNYTLGIPLPSVEVLEAMRNHAADWFDQAVIEYKVQPGKTAFGWRSGHVFTPTNFTCRSIRTVATTILEPGHVFDMDMVVFALAHEGFVRKLDMAYHEIMNYRALYEQLGASDATKFLRSAGDGIWGRSSPYAGDIYRSTAPVLLHSSGVVGDADIIVPSQSYLIDKYGNSRNLHKHGADPFNDAAASIQWVLDQLRAVGVRFE